MLNFPKISTVMYALYTLVLTFVFNIVSIVADVSSSGTNDNSATVDTSDDDTLTKLKITLPTVLGFLFILTMCFCCYRNRGAKPCRMVEKRFESCC